jgi:hypothetical protein
MQNLNFIFGTEEQYQNGLNQYRIEANLQTTNDKTLANLQTTDDKTLANCQLDSNIKFNNSFVTKFYKNEELRHGGLHKWQPQNSQQF